MASIEIINEATGETPSSVERLDVIVWGNGGQPNQELCIGSGANFDASSNFWLEIRYSVEDVPVFYTRNVLSSPYSLDAAKRRADLDDFINSQSHLLGFGDMLPETSLLLKRETFGHKDSDEKTFEFAQYILTINLDMGAVFGHAGPGERMLAFRWDIEAEEGIEFMRAFIDEIERANQGLHPDPGSLPLGFSDWPFLREINRRAYDNVSTSYKSNDFDNPLLAEAFQSWLLNLPGGAHILDAGCGPGAPVIEQLLASGFQVTGCDLSSEMLTKAQQQFPDVEYWECAITELKAEELFDAACSFSSLLYQDLIDFFHSIHRLYQALKPGGLLFLYGYDLHPSWRGMPYHVDLKQWMWGGTRGIDETVQALEEHGYFKVVKSANVITDEERLERIEGWREYRKKEYEKLVENMPPDHQIPEPDLSTPPANLAYPYVVVAQKLAR